MHAPDAPDASDDTHDPHAHAGDGIAEDRLARIRRRFAYSAAALATAGLIVALNGCGSEPEQDATDTATPSNEGSVATELPVGMPNFVPLPTALENFALFPTDGAISFNPTADGVILDGRGYFASTEQYGPDFTVTYEYRFPKADPLGTEEVPGENTGCLLFIDETDKVWPRCLEVQGKWGETASIKSNAKDVTVESTLDEPARDAARKPQGDWNAVTVVSEGGALTVTLNGEQVSTSQPTALTRGRIGFQAEGYPVEFRGMSIGE
ncbi:3-keto-disaccharide hydrolase [Alienimonas californiensis]|uniref:3-keto-alpha-glucoside-1,2-lyase/3-keto-2-hydroxy-glucal hydratase domain-containing protein n=1 Tax=Alienimonas californiensis TaxID=2527989 RepID=A0A517PAY7_9PLAN|nr:DUF1080 domain-containing protein [Alienimonas californiensis]QDT16521.1 hypothetical protein CA12_26260 [Alienimonas californiensis]